MVLFDLFYDLNQPPAFFRQSVLYEGFFFGAFNEFTVRQIFKVVGKKCL